MTVWELVQELACYEPDAEVIFEVNEDFEPESETRSEWRDTVHIDENLEPTFISEIDHDCNIELGKPRKKESEWMKKN